MHDAEHPGLILLRTGLIIWVVTNGVDSGLPPPPLPAVFFFCVLGHGRLKAGRADALPPDRGQGQRVLPRRRAGFAGRSHRAAREDVQQAGTRCACGLPGGSVWERACFRGVGGDSVVFCVAWLSFSACAASYTVLRFYFIHFTISFFFWRSEKTPGGKKNCVLSVG